MHGIAARPGRLIIAAASAVLLSASFPATVSGQPTRNSDREKANMKVEITVGGKTLPATLEDNAAAQDFANLLPLTVTLEDYAATEKISILPRKLSTQGTPDGYHPRAGDIAYYAPWGNVAIFYKDGRYSPGLVKLGTLDTGLDALTRNPSMKATIAAVP